MPDATEKKHLWRTPLAIFFLALALRLVGVRLFYNSTWNDYQDHLLFGFETGRIARSIAEGHGFGNPISVPSGPTAWLTPVYPYLLAGVFKLCGVYTKTSALVILGLNALFSALICFPLFYMAKRSFGGRVAVTACWIWALYPYFIYIPGGFVWDTCLGALLVATLFLCAMKLRAPPDSVSSWLGFGLLGGFTVLTNASALTVCLVLGAWAIFPLWQISRTPSVSPSAVISRDHWRWLSPALLVAAGLVITLLPWQVRNYRAFHALVPLRDNFWLEFWDGNDGNTTSWVDIERHPTINPDEGAVFAKLGEIPYMREKRRKALDFLAQHPGLYLVQCVRRFLYVWTGFWNLDPSNRLDEFHGFANVYLTSSLTLAMFLGLWRALRTSGSLGLPSSGSGLGSGAASGSHSRNVVLPAFRSSREAVLPYLLVLTIYPLIFYITHPTIRHRHAIDPEIVVLAALGLRSLFPASSSSRSPAVPPTATPSSPNATVVSSSQTV